MKLLRIYVDGFRCLKKFELFFEPGLTVLVGENDSGKTSVVDSLKVVTQNKPVELDDINYDSDAAIIDVEIENLIYRRTYERTDTGVEAKPMIVIPTEKYINSILSKFDSPDFDTSVETTQSAVKDIARMFGIAVRSNSNVPNLVSSIRTLIEEKRTSGNFDIEGATFPSFKNIQLDGKQFENISSFFKALFLNDRQKSIWQENISDGKTIEQFVKDKISEYGNEISQELKAQGIVEKIQVFLADLTEIKIEPQFETRDLNIDAKVKFLEGKQEINIQKKGDGTKRRISMALLEMKKDLASPSDDGTTYLLDEPDTHLHVRAQMDLLRTLLDFCKKGSQVIVTTHSPFFVNAILPEQIRLLYQKERNVTKVKELSKSTDIDAKVLRNIGIENSFLFFSRKILIVEGETEEAFIPAYFENQLGFTVGSRLVKMMNARGIKNIYGFSQALLKIHDPGGIFAVYDNDATSETKELLGKLGIPAENRLVLGNKEFEDCFTAESLHHGWVSYLRDLGSKSVPETWTTANIEALKSQCQSDPTKKFSSLLAQLTAGSKKFSKPIFGEVLGKYTIESVLPVEIAKFVEKIVE